MPKPTTEQREMIGAHRTGKCPKCGGRLFRYWHCRACGYAATTGAIIEALDALAHWRQEIIDNYSEAIMRLQLCIAGRGLESQEAHAAFANLYNVQEAAQAARKDK